VLASVEELRQVNIDTISVTLLDDTLDLLGGSMGGSVGAKAEARFREARVEDRR
jgi:hypothetical protein